MQVDYNIPVALNRAVGLCVPATLRMNDVVAVAGLPEHRDFHVLKQADVLPSQIRRLGRLHRENGAVRIHL